MNVGDFLHLWSGGRLRATPHRVGLNLSAEVYDKDGASQENAFWLDGQLYVLGPVRFELPERSRLAISPWMLRGDEVDLRFTPLGARQDEMRLPMLSSRFVQPYGRFEGLVRGVAIRDVFGVVEDHDSLW